jgi:hemolysin D
MTTLGRHWAIWKEAWRAERESLSGDAVSARTPDRRAMEFLPAVLEIEQAPPPPISRAILWTILALFAAGSLWAAVGRIDIVATAQGKIIPSGHSKVIQPYETGVIAAIHVQDGQTVRKGDVLIELDPTLNRADRDRALNELRAAKVEAARLRALVAGRDFFETPTDADERFAQLQRRLLRDQLDEYQAKVEVARQQIQQRRAAVEQTREQIRRLEAMVPIEEERAETLKRLLEHEAATRMDFLQAEAQRIERTQELAVQRKKLQQDLAALEEAEKHYRATVAEFQQARQAELAALETKIVSLAQEATKAGQKAELQRLSAPIDGVVQQLAVHTVGGVVMPAQQLLLIVPQEHALEVEAQVENKDVGFVKEGQPVEVKVATFPFTLYGTVPGRVLVVSDDAVPVEQVGLVYPTRVSLDRDTIAVDGKPVRLSAGMAVTVEIKTGQRRVVEYLLSPLLKAVNESLRER